MPLPTTTAPPTNPHVYLQNLVELTDDEYTPPPPPAFDEDLRTFRRPEALEYGRQIKSTLFTLDPAVNFLNHGSYGSCSKPVMAVREAYLRRQEFEPIKFMEDLGPRLARVTRIVAKYVHAEPRQIALVPNASAGTTSVLRSFPFPKDSVIVSFNLEYVPVTYQMALTGLKQHVIDLSPPFSAAGVLKAFREALDNTDTIGMVVVDHITSTSGLVLPVKDIIHMCKTRGIPVLVDGAHAIGQIPLNLTDLQPDFYVSNFHKWMLSPKSAAFLYIREPSKYTIRPTVISHGFGHGTFAEFNLIGTMDYSASLAVPASLAFHDAMGGTALMARNHDVCVTAALKLAETWQTTLLTDEVDTMIGSICVVELPPALFVGHSDDVDVALETLRLVLRTHYRIEAKTAHVGGIPGLRISTQMYNEAADYDDLGAAVLDILTRDAADLTV
ncbi:hypothetical protein H257_16497 [Aphanomyces astaci]|uniref:Aminotransferase class V domain-containing protein n=1 Tax=Aphanomyces astaci TaxID=112090 RepID=W4FK92_APHAT|nr:hypothetical protein, variant 1 [Aphanomyces astaci]XP_009843245.1 hypothetical protein H257_16497 [Aphanomyces astaci]ETV67254.1 hypothetical protein H257_16497 [Aphanomyces astaci]ETV67255.1 hypothetical protein, variant 1 [Aphanomyces astaci]RQM18901.1 hypothetical protein B5M09_009785 [Aphanomyces astaci]|eukprot:XP_009843243.1 hypothetical protein, variant 1 [Aphanomyces astaci]